ncbi:MAG TPA: hypothetical protein VGQ65_00270 [Thermoanaerobaculia bacterium]|jgi:hypothetical protein|nr:hypothetical protein [Thermoanaerobaculia bacterium]
MEYEYKVVPFIGQSRGNLSAANVAQQLERAINEQAARGWAFHQLSDVNIEIRPGCISGLFGAQVQYVRFDQLIFRTERLAERAFPAGDSQPDALLGSKRDGGSGAQAGPTAVAQEIPTRSPLPSALKHLEAWRRKSDDEIRSAAANLENYTDEARAVIREEIAWRSLETFEKQSQDAAMDSEQETDDLSVDSFCYHCGADVPVRAKVCSSCGKSL